MAVFQFSTLSDGQSLVFNPNADVLNFDQTAVAAADLRVTTVGTNLRVEVVNGPQTGKDVTLQNVSTLQLATTNVTFADGSKLLFGDNSTAQNDNLANSLTGTAGRDLLQGFGGADTMNGGAGNDTYIVGTGDVLSEVQADNGGTDTVVTDVNWTLSAGVENVTVVGTGNVSVTGNELASLAIGNAGNNYFNMRAGDDTIQAGAGNDWIDMSAFGFSSYGDDVIDGGAGTDTVNFAISAGQRSAITVDLTAGTIRGGGVEGGGSAVVSGVEHVIGAGFNDSMKGGSAAETLEGREGNDTLSGMGGNDTLIGGTGQDIFLFAAGPGTANADAVSDFVSATDKLTFDNSVFTGLGAAGNFTAGDARFAAGAGFTSGRDASDRLVYNTTTGQLFYDADGNGAGASQLVATLQGAPALSATDILVTGAGGSNTINGTPGNDSLVGTEGNEVINGFGSDDTLVGGGGVDTLDGGLGNDTYDLRAFPLGGAQDSVIVDAGGIDSVITNFDYVLPDGTENLEVFEAIDATGNALDNVIINHSNESRAVHVDGAAGNDTLVGGPDADFMTGGTGNDTFLFFQLANLGDAIEDFTSGNDRITLGSSGFTQLGAAGNFAPGDARFVSGPGAVAQDADDRLIYDSAGGFLYYDADGNGAGQAEFVVHLRGAPTLVATDITVQGGSTEGSDLLTGTEGNDSLSGLGGGDTIRGLGGNDTLDGGAGADILEGDDGDDLLRGGDDHDQLDGRAGNDTVMGDAGDDEVNGGAGNDLMVGGAGDDAFDLLFNGDRGGLDTMQGGAGNDLYVVATGDVILESTGEGNDTVFAFSDWTLGPNLENLSFKNLFGPDTIGRLSGTGNELDNVLDGEDADGATLNGAAGNDSLLGSSAADTLIGGAGIDTLNAGFGDDTYVVDASDVLRDPSGVDTVVTDVSWTLGADFENLTMTGTGSISVTGHNGANLAIGNSGNNYFNLRAGNDTIQAGAGNDWIDMSAFGTASYGDDVIDGGAGTDTVNFAIGAGQQSAITADLTAGAIRGGGQGGAGGATVTSIEHVIGAGFNDAIKGSAAAETLEGREGNDTLSGMGGNDTLVGGTGSDSFVFAAAPGTGNVDLVSDFVSGTDKAAFDNAVFTALGADGSFVAGDARFAAGAGFTSGHDASDRIVYNTTTGQLFYDADGSGAGAAQLVATFQGVPAIAATDIAVI